MMIGVNKKRKSLTDPRLFVQYSGSLKYRNRDGRQIEARNSI